MLSRIRIAFAAAAAAGVVVPAVLLAGGDPAGPARPADSRTPEQPADPTGRPDDQAPTVAPTTGHGHTGEVSEPVEQDTTTTDSTVTDPALAAAATRRIRRQLAHPTTGCCTHVTVTGLAQLPADGDVVTVLVAWQGTTIGGASLTEVTPTRWRRTADGWQPTPIAPASDRRHTDVIPEGAPACRASRHPSVTPRPHRCEARPVEIRRGSPSRTPWSPSLHDDYSSRGPAGARNGRNTGWCDRRGTARAMSVVATSLGRAPKALRFGRTWT